MMDGNILVRLEKMKDEASELKKKHNTEGSGSLQYMRNLLDRIVSRIYPIEEAENIMNKYHRTCWIATSDTSFNQRDYLDDINNLRDAIDLIIEEYALFGLDDFKPVKEKVETEAGVKLGPFKLGRKKTREK